MARISKVQLKGLIKECLIEILTEGTGVPASRPETSQLRESRKKSHRQKRPPRSSALDNIRFEKNVKSTVDQITDNPIMASIFADTATTTLQEQINAESRHGTSGAAMDAATYTADQSDPMDLFGGAAENWATLAFNEKKHT